MKTRSKRRKGPGKRNRIEQPQHARKRVMAGRNFVVDQPRQSLPALRSEKRKLRRVVRSAQARGDHHHDQIDKPIARIAGPRILKRAEIPIQTAHGSSSPEKLPNQRTPSTTNHATKFHMRFPACLRGRKQVGALDPRAIDP